ncbi:phage tail protein [Liquorilactobacillus capillatus]|uniref:Minor structural protein n=1 Tax=Liquorilactobacillus capillatus DSM 19910 TaxID=1423731 RepID=A0A0R1M3B4_9LACO|nr:phage tail protein [Liquorilactobacillus capillatus]KRL02527.1 minor structural protein [Liquorilactobacillus capillatus DSM 19910]
MIKIEAVEIKASIAQHKYFYFGFEEATTNTNPWGARPSLCVSNNGSDWDLLTYLDNLGNLRDGDITKIGDWYYLIGTFDMYKTQDFVDFTTLNLPIKTSSFKTVWAPEFVLDKDGNYHIVYAAGDYNQYNMRLYMADFNPETDAATNLQQSINIDLSSYNFDFGNIIDGDVKIINDKYILAFAGNYLFQSDNLLGPYKPIKTNFAPVPQFYGKKSNPVVGWTEGPYLVVGGDNVRLYSDQTEGAGVVYREAQISDLTNWSVQSAVNGPFKMRHGSILVNESASKIYTREDDDGDFDEVVKVKALHNDQVAPLSMACIQRNTFNVQWQENSTFQVAFTAVQDNSLAYALITTEGSVFFNGQEYIIKSCIPDSVNGVDYKQVTAIHVFNEISRVRQRNVKTGTLTYNSPADVLSFYLNDKTANPFGFTYKTYGNFSKQQITDLGNTSGADMLSKIISTWSDDGVVIYPNNKEIGVYTKGAFEKSYGRRIDYIHDSSEVKLTVDSTSITNSVKIFPKALDNTGDNTATQYVFSPKIVQDATSIKKWGLHPADDYSNENFTIEKNMENYVLNSVLSPDPTVAIEVTNDKNEMPVAGEIRHLTVEPMDFTTDVSIIGYTWYPFDDTQPTQLTFANLPATVLNQDANINKQIKAVNALANEALNRATTSIVNYYTATDPSNSAENVIKNGDLWTKPIRKQSVDQPNGIMTLSALESDIAEEPAADDTTRNGNEVNKYISNSDQKVLTSVWSDGEWVNINNTLTMDNMVGHLVDVDKQVDDAKEGIQTAVDAANAADAKGDQAIQQAGFATNTANTAKQVADNLAPVVAQVKSDSGTALTQSQTALTNAKSALDASSSNTDKITSLDSSIDTVNKNLSDTKADLQKSISDNQTTIFDVSSDLSKVSQNLSDTKTSLKTISDLATQNGKDINTTNSTVNGIKTDLANTKGDVTELQTTASGLSADMVSANGDISSLKARAGSLESNMSTATGDISTLKQTTNSLSSQMSGKVDTTVYQSDKTQTANSISNVVTKLDSIQIGGANLWSGTKNFNSQYWYSANATLITDSEVPGFSIVKSTTNWGSFRNNQSITFEKNVPYTVSVYAKGASSGNMYLTFYTSNDSGIALGKYLTASVTDDYVRYSVTFIGDGNTYNATRIEPHGTWSNVGNSVYFYAQKLEKGNVATDYSRADADKANQNDFSAVSQKVDSITNTVSSHTGDISQLKQSATTMQSDIKDNADNISSVKQTATKLSSDMQNKVDSSTYTTDKTQTAKDISSKASQTDFNTLKGTVNTQGTTISQNSKDIALKANSTDVNNLTGRVSTAESNITANANAITQKVSANDVQNMLTPYATQTYTQSQIKQSADGINSNVTKLQNQVNNTQIGGANLLTGTSASLVPVKDITGGYAGFTQKVTGIVPGQPYTGQATVNIPSTNSGAAKIKIDWYNTSGNLISTAVGDTAPNTGVTTTIKITATAPSNTSFAVYHVDKGIQSEKWNLGMEKLEKGNVATDYSVADADLATVTALSSVSQKADSISQTVTNNKSDADSKFTNINQTISGIQSTVANKAESSVVTQLANVVQTKVSTDDYNSKITQLSNDINLRVSKGNVISQMNQEAGGNTLIQVSNGKGKLYLDAASVVFGGNAFISDAMITNLSVNKLTGNYITTAGLHQTGNGMDTWIDQNGIHQSSGGQDTWIKNGVIETNIVNAKDYMHIGNYDTDPRLKWGINVTKSGIEMQTPVKLNGHTSNNASDYETEIQGYVRGFGWNYQKATAKGSGESGILIGLTPQQWWGNPYGGDQVRIGSLSPVDGSTSIEDAAAVGGLLYSPTGVGVTNGFIGTTFLDDVQLTSTTYFGSGKQLKAYNSGNDVHFVPASGDIWFDTNGHKFHFGGFSTDGGSWFNETGKFYYWNNSGGRGQLLAGDVTYDSLTHRSRLSVKKDVTKLELGVLADKILNIDLASYHYKDEASSNKLHYGQVIDNVNNKKKFKLDDIFINDEGTGVNESNLITGLIDTVQQQQKEIDSLKKKVEKLAA